MNELKYLSWMLGPVLQIALLACMIRGKMRATFPRFFTYIVFQLAKTGVLYLVYRYHSDNYFDAYWTGNAISIFLAVTVIDEIWHNLFRQYEGIQGLGSVLFRWACILMLLIAVVSAFPGRESNADRVVAAVLSFDRSMRMLQCGLFFLVLLLCRLVRNFWRHQVFGIALGFGIFASVELILVSLLTRFGNAEIATISLVKSFAYDAVLVLWIGYLREPLAVEEKLSVAPALNAWNYELLTEPAAVAGDQSFLTMVEDAVERVLTRSSTWPRPASKGSRIISRKPYPEDRN